METVAEDQNNESIGEPTEKIKATLKAGRVPNMGKPKNDPGGV